MAEQETCPEGCAERFAILTEQIKVNRSVSIENKENIETLDKMVRGNGRPGILTNQAILEQKLNQLLKLQEDNKRVMIGIAVSVAIMIIETVWQLFLT
jgi:hypothetical protein